MHGTKSLLLTPVVVVSQGVARFASGLDKCFIERVPGHFVPGTNRERSMAPTIVIFSVNPAFSLLKIRQTRRIVPAFRTQFFPPIEVPGMTSNIDHPVNR